MGMVDEVKWAKERALTILLLCFVTNLLAEYACHIGKPSELSREVTKLLSCAEVPSINTAPLGTYPFAMR